MSVHEVIGDCFELTDSSFDLNKLCWMVWQALQTDFTAAFNEPSTSIVDNLLPLGINGGI